MPAIQIISVLLPLALVVVAGIWWQQSRANKILRRWAQAADMELVSAQKRYLRTGPFLLQHTRGQFVFRIVVRDRAGMQHSGWLRVGSWLAGVLSEQTKVIWDS
jgi:hypothetical protein